LRFAFPAAPQSRLQRIFQAQGNAQGKGVEGLWNTAGKIVEIFTPQECANYFAACGYDPG